MGWRLKSFLSAYRLLNEAWVTLSRRFLFQPEFVEQWLGISVGLGHAIKDQRARGLERDAVGR